MLSCYNVVIYSLVVFFSFQCYKDRKKNYNMQTYIAFKFTFLIIMKRTNTIYQGNFFEVITFFYNYKNKLLHLFIVRIYISFAITSFNFIQSCIIPVKSFSVVNKKGYQISLILNSLLVISTLEVRLFEH